MIQTSKVVAILYVMISLVYSVIGIFMVAFGSGQMRWIGIVYIFMPIIMGIMSFLMLLLCCWLYNVIAKWVGGVEFTVEDVDVA